jgi:hypothetical protein
MQLFHIFKIIFYPQSEIDLNPENVKQKAGMNVKVFGTLDHKKN